MSSVSKSFGLSSSLQEEVMVIKKQGIVSILGSDCERTKSASLRRTLSADMSSKKWLSQHGFSQLKKIASSEEFTVSSSYSTSSSFEEEETEPHQTQFEIWSTIRQGNNKEVEKDKPGQFDIWNSILSQKEQEPKNLLPPYIHPLVKRSASCLSEKSLDICTESLGSETGSDGFSSYPPSEIGDAEDVKEDEQEEEKEAEKYDVEEDWPVPNYNLSKKSPPRLFPPPLPSLSSGAGASLHMKVHRDNGRLVLEAVSVPSQNNFKAQRHDGRLVLTFINNPSDEEAQKSKEKNDMGLFEVEIENFEDGEKEGTATESETEVEEVEEWVNKKGGGGGRGESEEVRFVIEEKPKMSSGAINVHRLALMMNKSIVLSNRNPTWPNKFSEEEEVEVEEEVNPITPLTQSLPPRPPVARMMPIPPAAAAVAASSFNPYEYYWKPKPMATAAAATVLSPITQKPTISNNNKSIVSKNILANEKQELLVLRWNKGDCIAPLSSNGCKEPRRSLLFWEPYCIATS